MIKPDLIVTWPRNNDYPLWRQYIRDNRTRFNNVIIVFMDTNVGPDFTRFVLGAMFKDFVLFINSPTILPGQDWRDVAVKAGLYHSLHSEYVYFTEQDFFTNPGFWEAVDEHEGEDYIGVMQGGRLHPCSLLLKRHVLDEIKLDFAARPDQGYDHFGLIQTELELHRPEYIYTILGDLYYKHYNGLSHNFSLITRGEPPVYMPEEFKDYLEKCTKVRVPLDEKWLAIVAPLLTTPLPEY